MGGGFCQVQLLATREVGKSAGREWNGRNGETVRWRSGEITHRNGKARLLPSRNDGKWFFLEGSAPALPKIRLD
ncbi:hypothetical protein B0813_001709 [Candidatus Fervidibacteria bacterium JGI MDM2 SSWTFF-3-K9]